jgi:hypothetical protein
MVVFVFSGLGAFQPHRLTWGGAELQLAKREQL